MPKKLLPYLGLLLSLGFLIYWLRGLQLEKVGALLQEAKIAGLAVAAITYLAFYFTYAKRTQILLRNKQIKLEKLFLFVLGGAYLSLFAPGAGEVGKLFYLQTRFQVGYALAFCLGLIEKMSALLCYSAFALLAWALFPPFAHSLRIPAGILGVTTLLFLRPFLRLASEAFAAVAQRLNRKVPRVGEIAQEEREFLTGPAFFHFHIWMLIRILLECAMYMALLASLGMDVPIAGAIVVRLLTILVTMLPLSPSALGTFELATVATLGWYGLSAEQALAVALLERVLFIGMLIPLGAYSWNRLARP